VPYLNGGYENSSRVFGPHGWDMPTVNAVYIDGVINDPAAVNWFWSVEIAFPLASLTFNETNVNVPPKMGDYWRINFSRVEWHVTVVNDTYQKIPNIPEDNWVWAPTGVVDIHLPEYWSYLQFSTAKPGRTPPVKDPDWTIRYIAMQLYSAEVDFATANNGTYTTDLAALSAYAPSHTLDGTCTQVPEIVLVNNGLGYMGYIGSLSTNREATINDLRYLLVENNSTRKY